MKKTKKVKEPVLTAEEKASKTNKADIKFTGKLNRLGLTCRDRFQYEYDMLLEGQRHA